MSTELVPLTLGDKLTMAQHFAAAGLFQTTNPSAALVRIQAGAELGIPPFAAMSGIHIIEGKPSLGATLYAALIESSPDHDLELLELNDDQARVRFWSRSKRTGDWIIRGEFGFTWKDACRIGLSSKSNWQRYRQQMLYWRAVSNGARMHFPGLCCGLYTPEELGAPVNDQGDYAPPARPAQVVSVEHVEPIEPEETPDQAAPPPIDVAADLRTRYEEQLLLLLPTAKGALKPILIAEALDLTVPDTVARLFGGRATLKVDALRPVELIRLLAHFKGSPITKEAAEEILNSARPETEETASEGSSEPAAE